MRTARLIITAVSIGLLAPVSARGQGTLGSQGFGYPPGQLSTRALGTGGGLGLFDAESPLNPAAIALSGDPRVFLQYEPESRRFSAAAGSARTMTARFPVVSASVPFGSRGSVGISASTFIDRSSETRLTREQTIGGQVVTTTERLQVQGAINDVRLAVGYTANRRIQLGIGGHVYTGQNRLFFAQTFPDTLKFNPVSQVSTLGYTGFAVSAGAMLRPSRMLSVALSGRKGGDIQAKVEDTTVSEASIPDRYSVGVAFEGLPGTAIAAHLARDRWSSLNGLGSAAATARDGWETGIGAETLGPRFIERVILFRAGARYRTLPFLAAGSEVKEMSFSGGAGAQFFRNRAAFDMALQYSRRSSDAAELSEVRERSLILSFGLRVRP